MHSTEGIATDDRIQIIQKKARELYDAKQNWAVYFREILGTTGLVHKLYPEGRSLAEFEKTDEYMGLQDMLNKLRNINGQSSKAEDEGTRVITVRLPSCVHEALKNEAHQRNTSMNQLCISKLLARIEAAAKSVENENDLAEAPESHS
jgi:predicted HicB family RNase H-like nuclease